MKPFYGPTRSKPISIGTMVFAGIFILVFSAVASFPAAAFTFVVIAVVLELVALTPWFDNTFTVVALMLVSYWLAFVAICAYMIRFSLRAARGLPVLAEPISPY